MPVWILYSLAVIVIAFILVIAWRAMDIWRRFSSDPRLLAHRNNAMRLQLGRDLGFSAIYVCFVWVWLPQLLAFVVSWPFWWIHDWLQRNNAPGSKYVHPLVRRLDAWTDARNQPLIAVMREVRGPHRYAPTHRDAETGPASC